MTLPVAWGPVRQMVEDAAIELLGDLARIAGGYVETLDTYNGELDSEQGLDRLIKQALGGAPVVVVGAQESTFSRGGLAKRTWREDVQLEIVVVSNSLRGLAARRRVGPDAGPQTTAADVPRGDPGVYRILEDVRRRILGGQMLIDGVDAAELVREGPVFTVEALTVWRATYRIGVAFTVGQVRGPVVPAETVQVDHELADAVPGVNPVVSTTGE